MRRALTGVAVLFFLLCASARASLPPSNTTLLLYARALQAFNPSLDGTSAVTLARSTIEEADAYGLDARLLVALVAVESNWRPGAVSRAGALGLGQLMPATAAGLGVDPSDPLQNLHGVAAHLRSLLDRYADRDRPTRYELALAAYNAGAGAVARYGGVPPYPETLAYVRNVMALWGRLSGRCRLRPQAAPQAEPPSTPPPQPARPVLGDLEDRRRAPSPKRTRPRYFAPRASAVRPGASSWAAAPDRTEARPAPRRRGYREPKTWRRGLRQGRPPDPCKVPFRP